MIASAGRLRVTALVFCILASISGLSLVEGPHFVEIKGLLAWPPGSPIRRWSI
jgi:hypothetical protein